MEKERNNLNHQTTRSGQSGPKHKNSSSAERVHRVLMPYYLVTIANKTCSFLRDRARHPFSDRFKLFAAWRIKKHANDKDRDMDFDSPTPTARILTPVHLPPPPHRLPNLASLTQSLSELPLHPSSMIPIVPASPAPRLSYPVVGAVTSCFL